MATRTPATKRAAGLEQRFLELAERWREETQFYSMSRQLVEHPAYREILQMGEVAVPWILRDMAMTGARWTLSPRRDHGRGSGGPCRAGAGPRGPSRLD